MARTFLYDMLIRNMKQQISRESRAYMTKEKAYEALKRNTEQDFSYDIAAWEKWLIDHNEVIDSRHFQTDE